VAESGPPAAGRLSSSLAGTDNAVRLPPAINALVGSFLADEDLTGSLLGGCGSPLKVVFPGIFAANVAELRRVLEGSGLGYRMFYAHKANQARAFAQAAFEAGIGIDVASPGELGSALSAGFAAGQMAPTGPKSHGFLRQLAAAGVTVNVDNLWELSQLIELAHEHGRRLPVLVRFSGFGQPQPGPGGRVSRFGVPVARSAEVLGLLQAGADAVDFLGPSFHLDSSQISDRSRPVSRWPAWSS